MAADAARRRLRGRDCCLPVRPLAAAARAKPGVDLDVLQGAGHLTSEDRPERVAEAIGALV